MSRSLHEKDLLDFAADFRDEGDERFDLLLDDPDAYFALAKCFENDRDLADDRVPMSHFLFFSGERLVGMSRLRRRLIPVLMLDGGHIGFEVRRSDRGKGYATEILKRTLAEARDLGIPRALLTAVTTNISSLRVIEKSGGEFDQETISPRTGERMRRFWVRT
jgi:predicted acetyltransferase